MTIPPEGICIGKHRDVWARELIAQLVLVGREISVYFPIEVEVESKVHRGFIDVAWYQPVSKSEKIYFCVFEIETSKSDWERIRSNSAKLVSLQPAMIYHIFKPGVHLNITERNELKQIHSGRKCYVINNERQIRQMLKKLGDLFSRRKGLGAFKRLKVRKEILEHFEREVEEGKYESTAEAVTVAVAQGMVLLFGMSNESYKKCTPCPRCGSCRVYFDYEIRKAICLNCGQVKGFHVSKHSTHALVRNLELLHRSNPQIWAEVFGDSSS